MLMLVSLCILSSTAWLPRALFSFTAANFRRDCNSCARIYTKRCVGGDRALPEVKSSADFCLHVFCVDQTWTFLMLPYILITRISDVTPGLKPYLFILVGFNIVKIIQTSTHLYCAKSSKFAHVWQRRISRFFSQLRHGSHIILLKMPA